MTRLKFLWRLLRDTFNNFLEDRTLRMAGALAYYSVFSMAPLILIAIGVASQFFNKQAAREQILDEIRDTVGPSAKEALTKILQDAGSADNGVVATVVGVVLLLAGASGVFAELQDGLNNIWQVKPKPGLGIRELIKNRLLSVTVVLGTGFLLLVSLVLTAVLAALGELDGAPPVRLGLGLAHPEQRAVAGRGGAAVRHDLQDPAGRQDRLARRVDRGGGDGGAVHDRQGDHRLLPRPQRPGQRLTGRPAPSSCC